MAEITSQHQRSALTRLNGLSIEGARTALMACCGAREWATMVASGRPYASLDDLLSYADAALATLSEQDVAEALAAHPRIGQSVGGGGREAFWSRREQAGTADATSAIKQALVDGNAAYEQRFGRVFLICATGLSAERMLAALHTRLANDADTERAVVREELRKITRLRIRKLVHA